MNKSIVFFLTLVFACTSLFAQQKFKTHAVKEGETIESIAKLYRVTPADILKLNPEAKKGVKPNTIIIIPGDTTGTPAQNETKNPVTITQEVRFIKHKVKRKETLYGIAKQYNITEEDIKRYNKDLYSRQLEKGEKIDIPRFANKAPEVENPTDLVVPEGMTLYTVKPKEGKWRVAYEHGISVQELERLNPQIGDALKEGESIIVPAPKGSLKQVDDANYNYYTVLPKEGFYRLKVKLGVSQEEIEALNPEVKTEGLKVGMILKLPKGKTGDYVVKEGKLLPKFSLLDSIDVSVVPNVAVVIPFKLKEFDFDSISDIKKKFEKDRLVNVSVDFYMGTLMALDSLKQVGLSANVNVYDSEGNENAVSRLLTANNFQNYDAVIGPILAKPFNRLAKGLQRDSIPVFAPMANRDIDLDENVFQTLPSEDMITAAMINFIAERAQNRNVIIIADKKNESVKAKLITAIPFAKNLVTENDAFVKRDELEKMLSKDKENWVIVESNSIPLLTNVTNLLNSLLTKDRKIMMLTTKKGDAYDTSDDIRNSYLSNLHFHYPTVDRPSDVNNSFHKNFEKKFGALPNRYAVRGFDLMMDIMLRLAYHRDLYQGTNMVGSTEYVENKFEYLRSAYGGYYNKGIYIVMYDNMEIKETGNDF